MLKKGVICAIVGSSSLKDDVLLMARSLEKTGVVCLLSHLFSHVEKYELTEEEMNCAVENGHIRIDIADACLAVYRNNHIGDSTLEELEYASSNMKPIYLFNMDRNEFIEDPYTELDKLRPDRKEEK